MMSTRDRVSGAQCDAIVLSLLRAKGRRPSGPEAALRPVCCHMNEGGRMKDKRVPSSQQTRGCGYLSCVMTLATDTLQSCSQSSVVRSLCDAFFHPAMMSVQTPPLSRSGSTPSNVGAANRVGPSAAPPTSLSLRSSYNQLLGRDVIKESVGTDGAGSATLPKSRQRYAMTSVRSVMGIGDNLSSKNQTASRGRGLPTKSSSSSALYSSSFSSSSALSNATNPKLAKNGANMQRRAESQQLELSRANTEGKTQDDPADNSNWPQLEKDNSQLPPFRRRTKSFLEYHDKGWDLGWGNKENEEETERLSFPEKEQASPVKERESQKEDKEEEEEEREEEREDQIPSARQPLLPVVVEAPLCSSSSSSSNSPEWVPENHQAAAHTREQHSTQVQGSPRSPAKPPRSSQPRVIKVELHPNNENQFLQQYPPSSPKQPRAGERNAPTRTREAPAVLDPQPGRGLPKVTLRMDLTPDTPSEDEDSSWTTLSQESPSPQSPQETDVWGEADLPPGWREISDSSEVYFWHVPTGTTQYHRPVASGGAESKPQRETRDSLKPPDERPSSLISDSSVEAVPSPSSASPSPSDDVALNSATCTLTDLKDYPIYPDPSLKAFEGATLRYASLKLNPAAPLETVDLNNTFTDPDALSFPVRSLGWVEMSEEDVCEGRSSVAVHHCIRQLSYCRKDIRDSAGVWGEGKGMLLVLRGRMLTLVDPDDQSLLHSQPIGSIRVWGVGHDHDRDFAYVARDKNTRALKCHVFRCDTPAAAIATSLHEICSKIMAERKSAKAAAGSSSQTGSDVPLQEFPMPKTELVQKFHVFYLGTTSVTRPIGMDIINGAIDSLVSSTGKDDWTPVVLSIADTTLAVIKEKEEDEDEALVECRVRFLSFMGVGRDVHTFAFIMDTGNQHFQCHVFWCDPNAGCVSEAVQAACVLRYQKCLVARPPSQRAGSSSSPAAADSVSRRVSTSVKRGVQSLIDTLKAKKQPSEVPQQ
ncbi:amyloid beta precursor protein binding family B member 2 isoform X2 [Syngnathoides biaculeatus]|uniref:amyloid beta precursor protein binding family B member 2 isoform X2 n=1 Tax=Syngnathoides biaculeatus TaxID=300417 RepID=UPI002ADE27C6|nr:amyloid beta precursor protein binding family B member 2 isoform X2 [Syngnathoides biaculeatus]